MRNPEPEYLPLPLSTSSTVLGPVLTVSPGVVLCYDHSHHGISQWIRIEFERTLAVQLRRRPCLIAEDIEPYHSLRSIRDSDWLIEMLARREDYLGIQHELYDDEKYRHYRIHFDGGGIIEAIAMGASISGPYDEMPVSVVDRAKPESD
jgi:hypothetical protein